MSNIIRLGELRRAGGSVCFTRLELNRLLSLYSHRVMSGEWRDYAIDVDGDSAVFSIFRSSLEQPLYAVAKRRTQQRAAASGAGRAVAGSDYAYVLLSGRHKLKEGASLDEVLAPFERRLELVPG